jgi:Mn-dependent DtxR family transcriptional regulator
MRWNQPSTPQLLKILTPSQENYLEHIIRLSRSGPVRVNQIAEAAGVRCPSVTKAITKLVKYGLVRHRSYGTVEITELGIQAARAVIRRDHCLSSLLVEVLNMDARTAKAEVCRIEHVLSPEVLSRLEILVQQATSKKSKPWLKALHGQLQMELANAGKGALEKVGTSSLHV